MPGKDDPKKKDENEELETNKFYDRLMEQADHWLIESFRLAKGGHTGIAEFDRSRKDLAIEYIARAIAFDRLAKKHGYGEVSENVDEDKIVESAEKMGKGIMQESDFRARFGQMNGQAVYNFFFDTDKTTNEEKRCDFKRLLEKATGELTEAERRRAENEKLVGDLRQSTQKSFFGKLKSFFVGNSKEYKTAFAAVQGLAAGTMDKTEAANAIKAYLDIRKNKVRDHQYGRDRFDAMMKSLATVMEPLEFVQYCKDVDDSRRARDKNYRGITDPNQFLNVRLEEAKARPDYEEKRAEVDEALQKQEEDPKNPEHQKPEEKPEEKIEEKPEEKTEVKPEEKIEVKPEVKTEVKPEPKTEVKPEVKPEEKPEPKPEVKPEPQPEENEKKQVREENAQAKLEAALEKDREASKKSRRTIPEQDAERILNDAKDPDRIRKNLINLDKMRNRSGLQHRMLSSLSQYAVNHPAIREEMRKIAVQKGFDLNIPVTEVDKLPPEAKKALQEQQEALKNPEQQKTEPQPEEKTKVKGAEMQL